MTWENRSDAGHLSTRRPADATFPELPDYGAVDLANTFAAIAREMETASSDPEHVCRVITRRAVDAVPGCSLVSSWLPVPNGGRATSSDLSVPMLGVSPSARPAKQ